MDIRVFCHFYMALSLYEVYSSARLTRDKRNKDNIKIRGNNVLRILYPLRKRLLVSF